MPLFKVFDVLFEREARSGGGTEPPRLSYGDNEKLPLSNATFYGVSIITTMPRKNVAISFNINRWKEDRNLKKLL